MTRTLKAGGDSSTVEDLNLCAVSDCVTINSLLSLRLINSVLSLFLLSLTAERVLVVETRVLKFLSICRRVNLAKSDTQNSLSDASRHGPLGCCVGRRPSHGLDLGCCGCNAQQTHIINTQCG